MNILPLIFTFLIIFLCIASTFLREVKSFYLAETTLDSFARTERIVNNSITKKAYRNFKGESLLKKENSSKKEKMNKYISKRNFSPPLENSKFNMTPLIKFEGEMTLHPLFEPLAELLRLLYKTKVFDQEPHIENVEYRLLEAMLKKAKKNPEIQDLSMLFPEDPVLSGKYYKMLKGTNQYSANTGIPPLENFLTFREGNSVVSICFASEVLLEALFDKETALEILQEEKKKWEASSKYYYFSKDSLRELLMKNPIQDSKYSIFESHFDYSRKIDGSDELSGKDKITGLSIKKSKI